MKVALLTGGKDPHYVRGLLRELAIRGVRVDLVGSEALADCQLSDGRVEFHNLIGSEDPAPTDGLVAKAWRVLSYYGRILVFAARTDAKLFHVLWFRKFPLVERTLLSAYFKLLGKKLVLTAHNVDDRARDGARPTLPNRLSLAFLYRTVDHVFVHTDKMKRELVQGFGIADEKVTVVPFGVNDAIPASSAPRPAARQRFGWRNDDRILLFFGNITPYKGVEDLLEALAILVREDDRFVLVLAGRVKDRRSEGYWRELESLIDRLRLSKHVRKEIRYIPDGDVGLFFRASDVSILPYRRVDQSGVLPLSYAQGLPVIAADVGSMREDVLEGETGLIFRSGDVLDLASKIRAYFAANRFDDLDSKRRTLREFAAARFSWTANGERTCAVYDRVLQD
jgi:D-inositol-3-phosphate glycosyltransferase